MQNADTVNRDTTVNTLRRSPGDRVDAPRNHLSCISVFSVERHDLPMTSIQYYGRDVDGVCRGGVAVGRPPAEIAEELFRFGWQTAILLRNHRQVVGWVRPDPNGSEPIWFGEQR
jgi:hypothetical protein